MALPDYSSGGFYDPQASYTSQHVPSFQLPQGGQVQWQYLSDQAPQAAYQNRLQELGLGGFGSRARKAQGLYGQSQIAFQQAKANDNFNLKYPDFLKGAGGNIEDQLANQSYEEQGLDPSRFGQRKYRWGMRGG